jgi:hypothetical protein
MKRTILSFYQYIKESHDADSMLRHPKTIQLINSVGGSDYAEVIIHQFLAKPSNYKPNTYYRVDGAGDGYAGVGNGLYLGRDKQALINFYDIEGEGRQVQEYVGAPNWMDLMEYEAYEQFEKQAASYGIDLINSNEVGKLVIELGHDGIRYYDPMATGEEFVLFNTNKLKRIK